MMHAKTYSMDSVIEDIRSLIDPDTILLPIENGITTDAVDDLIVKVGHAPQKKLKVVEKSVDDAR